MTLLLLRISRRFQHFRFKDTQKEKKKKQELNWKGVVFLYHPPNKSPGPRVTCTRRRRFSKSDALILILHRQPPDGGLVKRPDSYCTCSRIRGGFLYVCNSWSLYCYRIIERDFPARYIYSIHLHNGGKKRKTTKKYKKTRGCIGAVLPHVERGEDWCVCVQGFAGKIHTGTERGAVLVK